MASVTYKIGGKYDGKAVKSAKKDLGDLAKVVKGFAVVKVFQGLNKIAQATKSTFVAQNKALTTFNTAVVKSGKSLEKLNNLKSQLSKGNFFDDDSLNNAMALGVQMGLTNEQLEKVMKTATDMAASGVMPLDQAVKSLGKSFSGSVGTLSRVAPELANLTKEELENGKAVELMMERYAGFSDAMSNTFSGRNQQWSNSIDDLKASIGAIPQAMTFLTQGKLLEPLQAVTNWIVSNRNYILNFLMNIPSVVGAGLNLIKNMLATTFTGDAILNVIVALIQTTTQMITDVFNYMGNLVNNFAVVFVNLVTDMADVLKKKLTNSFEESAIGFNNALISVLENYFKQVVKVFEWILNPKKAVIDVTLSLIGAKKQVEHEKATGATTQDINTKYFGQIANTFKEFSKNYAKNLKNLGTSIGANYQEDIDQFILDMEKILGQDLPEDLQAAFDGMTLSIEDTSLPEPSTTSDTVSNKGATIGSALASGTGELGSLVNAIINNGIWGAIGELLGHILARIEEVSPIFQWMQGIFSEIFEVLISEDSGFIATLENFLQPFLDGFNAVKDILGGFLQLIAGILESMRPTFEGATMILNRIAPVITSILEVLGLLFQIVGVIGDMLNPILEVVLTVLAPILEVVNEVIKLIYRLIATIVNAVIDIYNWISWGPDIGHISTELKTTSTVTGGYATYTPDTTSTASETTVATTSGNASYTAAKDIYVNIYYSNSYVNGDAREIALSIRDEIRSAERLGY